MEPLNFLVIGMDPPVHFNFMIDPELIAPNFRLAAIAASHDDPVEASKLEEVAGKRGVKFSKRWQDLIEDVDAVAYLGPYGYRGGVFKELFSMDNLKTIIVDKPMACTKKELYALEAALAARPDLDLLPLLTVRYDLRYEFIKMLYDSGIIGKIIKVEAWRPHKLGQRPKWFFQKETYPGVIRDLCVHDVDIISYITGENFKTVSGAYEVPGKTEYGPMTLYGGFGAILENGAAVSISADWLTGPEAIYHGDTGICLTGTQGKIELISDGASKGLYVESKPELIPEANELFKRFQEETPEISSWGVETLDSESGYLKIRCSKTDYRLDFHRTLTDFFAYKEGEKQEPVVTISDLIKATRVTVMAGEMAQ